MNSFSQIAKFLLLLSCIALSSAVELTFELPDNAKECFYEDIEAGTDFTVEFQVTIYEISFNNFSSSNLCPFFLLGGYRWTLRH